MNKVFIFRGKAATGKTTITNILSNKLNVAVLRKDDIYDMLSTFGMNHSENNKASYDILGKILQTNVNTNCNVIIDVSLAHKPYLNQFLSKIDFKESEVYQFLCICSNNDEWKRRIEKRLDNPTPNQFFRSVTEAVEHYEQLNIEPLENEIILDSAMDISFIMKKIFEEIAK
ncbi:AAA family ATPase [Alkaliphilus peptidifermentans]|uniref:AAA domain-containing protein n=1 Tax=Alkaliphilus peptidifermentans DSM 18978 TaxID=1120976 RepID=A0A1G5GRP5_9FIRM|nr:AAA family ATPase [Alkaliphilus peptidifermentans]SCY54164.1 AAA domain-containing protein [Alkaliphilus peptidifermentans DSM 18978]